MQTTNDLDLELIFSLGDELEKHCESRWHSAGTDGHTDSALSYVHITGCSCTPEMVTIRCQGFIDDYKRKRDVALAFLGVDGVLCARCDDSWQLEVLDPA
jgi:hypothetical protein